MNKNCSHRRTLYTSQPNEYMEDANASDAHTHTIVVRATLPSGCERAIQFIAVASMAAKY